MTAYCAVLQYSCSIVFPVQMTAEKAALEREMNALQTDNDRLRANTEALVAEKWELSAANAGDKLLYSFFNQNEIVPSLTYNTGKIFHGNNFMESVYA